MTHCVVCDKTSLYLAVHVLLRPVADYVEAVGETCYRDVCILNVIKNYT